MYGQDLPGILSYVLEGLPIVHYMGVMTKIHRIVTAVFFCSPLLFFGGTHFLVNYYSLVEKVVIHMYQAATISSLASAAGSGFLMYKQPYVAGVIGTSLISNSLAGKLLSLPISQRKKGTIEVVVVNPLPCPKPRKSNIQISKEGLWPVDVRGISQKYYDYYTPDTGNVVLDLDPKYFVNLTNVTSLKGVEFNEWCPSFPEDKIN
jgi:hypothetical protein